MVFLIGICCIQLPSANQNSEIQILDAVLFDPARHNLIKILDVTSRFSASRNLDKKIFHYAHNDILDFRKKIDIQNYEMLWVFIFISTTPPFISLECIRSFERILRMDEIGLFMN